MSDLKKKDLHTPFTSLMITKILAHMFKGQSEQKTAVDATLDVPGMSPTTQDLVVYEVYGMLKNACASGESMSFDLQVDGVSILTTPLIMDSSSTLLTQTKAVVDPTKTRIPRGSKVTVVRDYTAGGGPTPIVDTKLVVEAYPA